MDFVNTAAALDGGVYSHAVVEGDRVYVSGQVATDRADGGPPPGDIEVETRVCMELLAAVLEEVGLTFADVVRVGVYMTDLREFDRMNGVYEGFFAPGRYPARTCIGVAAIPGGCRIEIDCVARA